MACYESGHWGYVAVGAVGVVLYMVGLPLAIIVILRYVENIAWRPYRMVTILHGGHIA